MTYKEYARQIAEAVRNRCTTVAILNHGCSVNVAANAVGHVDLDAIIASVEPPAAQEHDAPQMKCRKEPHRARGGYLHAEDDDAPYDVDGLRHCGRCHQFLGECDSHRGAR